MGCKIIMEAFNFHNKIHYYYKAMIWSRLDTDLLLNIKWFMNHKENNKK